MNSCFTAESLLIPLPKNYLRPKSLVSRTPLALLTTFIIYGEFGGQGLFYCFHVLFPLAWSILGSISSSTSLKDVPLAFFIYFSIYAQSSSVKSQFTARTFKEEFAISLRLRSMASAPKPWTSLTISQKAFLKMIVHLFQPSPSWFPLPAI
jgi:hypothetical protein